MITIDSASPVPPFEQLRGGLVDAISCGELAAGQRLPTVRALANDLGIAPGTVARTYRDLEAAGLVTTRRRVGTLVTAPAATLSRAAVTDAAARFVRLARDHALTDTEIRDVVAAALLVGGRPDDERSGDDRSATVSAG